MSATGTTFLSGLASNLDWASMVDQLIAVEHKKIDVVQERQTTEKGKLDAWKSFQGKLTTFKTKLAALRTAEDFNLLKVSSTTSSALFSASDLVSLKVDDTASPGNHTIQMTSGCQLAQARQVSSQGYSTSDEALGLSGEFLVNGRAVKVEATDSLLDVADRVNALNTGSNATHVTATVLSAGTDDYRLILTSDNTGAESFNLQEGGTSNVLLRSGGLGFYENYAAGTTKHATSDGAESDRFSSATVAVKSLLGLNSAASSTVVTIGGQAVTIDLSSDTETLTTIAGKIDTALGASGSAEVVSETKDGATTYRIDISGTTALTDSNNVLQTLGFVTGTQTSVAKTLTSGNTLNSGGLNITAATAFNAIDGYTAGTSDTITITGQTHDGVSLTPTTFNVYSGSAYKTVGDLCTAVQDAYTAAGASVTASVSGGKIQVVDAETGSSLMNLTLAANNQGGGNLNFGTVGVATQGYSQQTAVGLDSIIKVDGVYIQDDSNTIEGAVPGLTIDLHRIESGTTINVSVSRDIAGVQSAVQGVVDAYNDIITYVNQQFTYDTDKKTSGVLSGDFSLRQVKDQLQDILASQIMGLPSGWNALSLIGVESNSSGLLSLNASTFSSMARTDFAAFRRVLGVEGTTTDADISFIGYGTKTQPGSYAVNVTQAATQATDTGWKDLTAGIGATGEQLRITDSANGRQATISLDPAGNGSSINNLVNALNSEFGTVRTQVIVGSVANTKTSDATAISSSTTWGNITGATLSNGDDFTFEGTDRLGNTITGSYSIGDTATDTVQGLLSAIETACGGKASAHIDTSGRIVVQDAQSGDSSLAMTITAPVGSGLDFGTIDVTEGAGDGSVKGRSAMDITAADDGSGHLALTHGLYGSGFGYTVEQVSAPTGANQAVLLSGTANTSSSAAVTAATTFDAIDGFTAATTDTITISGTGHDGSAITPATFNIYDGGAYKTLGDLLTAVETAYSGAGYSVTASIENGKIKLVDGTTGLSGTGLVLTETTANGGLDLGSIGSAATGLAGGAQSGLDVTGTINGEACTGRGRTLTGATPDYGETNTVEGLAVQVNLTAAQLTSQGAAQGTVNLTAGAMEQLWRALDVDMDPTDGAVTLRTTGLTDRISEMDKTISAMEARLDKRRDQLTAQFMALEQAMQHFKSLSSWLTAQLGSS